jgi:phage-related minor tail protein
MSANNKELLFTVRETGAEQVKAKMGMLNSSIVKLGATLAVTTVAYKILKDSIREASEAEQGMTRVVQAIKSTGGAAGLSANQLKVMADNLEGIVSIDADKIMANLTMPLLTFAKITKDNFGAAQLAIIDMSRALGTDLQSAAIQVGKALQDPVTGLLALRRVGVSFSTAQKEVIKNLAETGRLAEAQRLIIQELNKEFGGQAAAYTKTYAGQLEQLNISANNLKESLGKGLLPILTKVTKALAELFNWNYGNEALDKINKNTSDIVDKQAEINKMIKETPKDPAIYNLYAQLNELKSARNELLDNYDKMAKVKKKEKELTDAERAAIEAEAKAMRDLIQVMKDMPVNAVKAQKAMDAVWHLGFGKDDIRVNMADKTAAMVKNTIDMADANLALIENMDLLLPEIEETQTAWQELGEALQNTIQGNVANALDIMVLSHQTAFNKLKAIMNNFVNSMISELNRYLAKMLIMNLFGDILTGGDTPGMFGNFLGNIFGIPSLGAQSYTPNPQPKPKALQTNQDGNNQRTIPAINVYVDPREIARANEYGQQLRYVLG